MTGVAAASLDAGMSADAGSRVRWALLWLTCGALFGQFFAFDIPSALNEQIRDTLMTKMEMTTAEYQYYFGLLYSVYSIPNVALPLVLGVAVDRCGCQVLIIALGLCVLLGQVIVAVGFSLSSWPVMLAGRVVFGLGGESLQVAQNTLLFRWFKGREVAFALGLNISVARAGSVLNDIISPLSAQRWGVVGALWVGAVLCFGSFLCNVASAVLDKREAHKYGIAESQSDEEEFSVREVMKMPKVFWLLTTLSVIIYCAILPFNNIASAFFVETRFADMPQAEAQQRAGYAMSLLFMVSAFGTPAFGGLIDMTGYRTHWLILSAVLLAATYASIFALPPEASMYCLGCVYTIFAGALWPSFALVVPQQQLGTAYGVGVAMQNAGLAVVPLMVGHMQATSQEGDFHRVIFLFFVFGLAGTVISVALHIANVTRGGTLDLPSSEAEQVAASMSELEPLQTSKHIKKRSNAMQ